MTTDKSDWAFGDFWKALNSHLTSIGLPELGFKDAREMWENAQNQAEHRTYQSMPISPKVDIGSMASWAVHGRGK